MLPNFELMFAMRMFARSRRFPRRAVQMGDDLENSFLCVELFLACAMGFADGQMRWSALMLAYEVVGGLLNAVAPECARSADPFDEADLAACQIC